MLIYTKPNSDQFQRTTDEVWWPFKLLKGQNDPSRAGSLPPQLLAHGDCSSSHRRSPPPPRRTRRTFPTGTAGAGGSRTAAARTCQGHHSSSGQPKCAHTSHLTASTALVHIQSKGNGFPCFTPSFFPLAATKSQRSFCSNSPSG